MSPASAPATVPLGPLILQMVLPPLLERVAK
jgi:hypothetical protein